MKTKNRKQQKNRNLHVAKLLLIQLIFCFFVCFFWMRKRLDGFTIQIAYHHYLFVYQVDDDDFFQSFHREKRKKLAYCERYSWHFQSFDQDSKKQRNSPSNEMHHDLDASQLLGVPGPDEVLENRKAYKHCPNARTKCIYLFFFCRRLNGCRSLNKKKSK